MARRFIQIFPVDNIYAVFKATNIVNSNTSIKKILYWGLLDDYTDRNKKLLAGLGNTNMVGIILSETGEPYCVEDYPIFIGYAHIYSVAGKEQSELNKIAENIIKLRELGDNR